MRVILLAILLPLLAICAASAQQFDREHSVEVTFSIDKQPVSCEDLKVTLRIGNQTIVPKTYKHSFFVPPIIEKLFASKQTGSRHNIGTTITCSHHSLSFANLYPVQVRPEQWKAAVIHPPFWFERFGLENLNGFAIEQGTWISYLDTECCEPGLETWRLHTDPQPAYVAHLLQQQPSAAGEQARDIAYALAVYHVDYEKNRDYLLSLFSTCLNMDDLPATDECSELLPRITNLSWRDDPKALQALLLAADFRTEVTHEFVDLADFYGSLLGRHTTQAIHALSQLPIGKQEAVCARSAEDSGYPDQKQRLARAQKQLRTLNNPTAKECLRQIENAIASSQ